MLFYMNNVGSIKIMYLELKKSFKVKFNKLIIFYKMFSIIIVQPSYILHFSRNHDKIDKVL